MSHAERALALSSIALVIACGSHDRDAGDPRPSSERCLLVEDDYGPDGEVPVRAEKVVSGLEVPWGILFLDGGDMLVTERAGRLRHVRGGALVDRPVAEIDAIAVGEGGLLGIAAHPRFAQNRLFYLYVTVREGRDRVNNRVEEWRLVEGGERLGAERVRVVLDGIPSGRFHNGGRLRVGRDGALYVGTGDARTPAHARDPRSLAGKVLRIGLDGSIPSDNPVRGSPVYLLGVRNTEGFDFRDDGAMLLADHGPSGELGRSGHDEIDVARAGDDLGWPTIYGCETHEGMVQPSLTWVSAVPPGGAAIYTGDAIDAWRGSLLVGTLRSRHLHRVVFAPSSARVARHEVYFRGDPPDGLGRVREVVMGPDRQLYVTTSNCDGRGTCPPDGDAIYRIVPDAQNARGRRDRTAAPR